MHSHPHYHNRQRGDEHFFNDDSTLHDHEHEPGHHGDPTVEICAAEGCWRVATEERTVMMQINGNLGGAQLPKVFHLCKEDAKDFDRALEMLQETINGS